MPAYHYVAVNSRGRDCKGVIEADNEKSARQLLRDQSLMPVSVRLAGEQVLHTAKNRHLFKRRWGLTNKELAVFTRQFATLLAAGLPIAEALAAVGEQNDTERVKGVILAVRAKVVEGHALAAALREHPKTFTPLFCSTVAAGEQSGHLERVLERLADYTEQQWTLRQKIRTSLIYPCSVVLVALAIVGFLLVYVVPKMIAVYDNLHQALPWLTVWLINISQFIKSAGLYLFIFCAAALYGWLRALQKSAALREKVDLFMLRLPLLGNFIKVANTARFSRTLSILSTSGVSVLEAMTISAQLITTIPIRHAVEVAVMHVREGVSIHLALKQTQYFSPMSVHMIASGEASGQLENMLDRVAANNESEIVRFIDVALALFEPAIILVMGVIVLFIVLAVLLPIFQLNQFTA